MVDNNQALAWAIEWGRGGAHMMVVAGYRYVDKGLKFYFLNTDNNATVELKDRNYPGSAFIGVLVAPPQTPRRVIGIKTDRLLSLDTDRDGVTDFDERRRWNAAFNLDSNTADTDKDGLEDKKDIEGWLFWGNPTNPIGMGHFDDDGDNLRAEVDPDSDNGGVYDGDEDFNGDANRAAAETNPYTAIKPNADDIPNVKISISTGKVVSGKRYVKGNVSATFTFYRKDGTTPLRVNPNTGPLVIQYRPSGGALIGIPFAQATVPTASMQNTFTLPNNAPNGKAVFEIKNGTQPVTILVGKEFYVDKSGGSKN